MCIRDSRTSEGITEECYFCFKVFSYTEAGHRKRFEQCDYTKQEYAARRESARIVKEDVSTFPEGHLTYLYLVSRMSRPGKVLRVASN